MGIINSLLNKCEELEALVRNQKAYPVKTLMCFMETWLSDIISAFRVELAGFTTIREDWDARESRKNKDMGLVLNVDNKWCHPEHIHVKEGLCCPGTELLAVGLRAFYVPREFSHIIDIVAHVPHRVEVATACDEIHGTVMRLQPRTLMQSLQYQGISTRYPSQCI